MKKYLLLDSNNLILSVIDTPLSADYIEVDTEEDIHVRYDHYIDGQIVHNNDYEINQQKATSFARILELKKLLADSDYMCLKHADGDLTDEEYEAVKAQRHAWRAEINELEQE